MEEVPKITSDNILRHEEEVRYHMENGTITTWLEEQLSNLNNVNPILYQYIMEHSQKFAMGAVTMLRDPQSIAISMALEQVILINMIGKSHMENKEIANFSSLMNTWFGGKSIEGLNDFGVDKDKGM